MTPSDHDRSGTPSPAPGDRDRSGAPSPVPSVTVSLPSLLEPVTGGVRELAVRGGSLREALDDLLAREPRLKPHLFNEAGEFRRHVLCFHNGTNTRWLAGLDAPVSDGDTILFMQAVSGG